MSQSYNRGDGSGAGSAVAVRQQPHTTVDLDNVADLDQALQLCDVLSQATLVPQALRGNPANILLVIMMGRDIGLKWAQALREIYCPPGGLPQMKGKLLLARVIEAGHGYTFAEGTNEQDGDFCEFILWRDNIKDEDHTFRGRFSIKDALTAQLLTRAQDGSLVAFSQNNRPMPWMLYPRTMLRWRAVAEGVGVGAPEVALGFDIAEATSPDGRHDEVQLAPQSPGDSTITETMSAGPPPAGTPTAAPAADPSTAPGPSPETVAALTDLDQRGSAAAGVTAPAGTAGPADNPEDREPASSAQQRELAEAFERFGWLRRKHKATILDACTAWCGRPILAAGDLTAGEVRAMIADMATINGPDEASPVLLADRVARWKQELHEREPATFETLFPEG